MRLMNISSALVALAMLSAPALAQQANEKPQADEKQQAKAKQQASEQPSRAKQPANDPQKGDSARQAGARQQQGAEPVVLTVTTVAFAESTGCWVRLHDGENFSGRTLTLMGAQSLPNLEFGLGYDWEGDIDSIQVGPKAKLALYDDENYRDDRRDLAANARVANLHQALFEEGVESLSLTCTGDAAG